VKIIRKIRSMQKMSGSLRKEGRVIGLVPTMGAFHDGHLSLIDKCRKACDITVVSIFVNNIQFGPKEDFKRYPKRFEADKKAAARMGVDYIFAPEQKKMYSESFSSFVDVEAVTQNLCGASRPGHFRGVATVVAKLFNIIKPHRAYFGEKDYQQLVVIKRMVADLDFDVKIYSAKTVRESDGLAMSSRNAYLNKKEREKAAVLYKSLDGSKRLFLAGEKSALKIIKNAVDLIKSQGLEIDYVKIVDIDTLKDIKIISDIALMAVAVKVGKARLIDNIFLKGVAK
jgi:pantoate--beta-alanine ligase